MVRISETSTLGLQTSRDSVYTDLVLILFFDVKSCSLCHETTSINSKSDCGECSESLKHHCSISYEFCII